MKRGKLMFFAFLLVSGVARAAGWTPPLTVVAAFTEGTTDILVINTSGGTSYASGCSVNDWAFHSDTDARRARAYATALAALTSGLKIRLWYSDTCGTWGYHQGTSIMLVQ